MKNAQEYARRFKRLMARLRREGGAGHATAPEDPMDLFLEAIFSNFVSEARAHSAVVRLRSSMVDLNELRVTPPSELVEVIGDDFPNRHAAVEAIIRGLNAIYNKTHSVDLTFLRKHARKRAESFINSLDSVSPYTKALVNMRCFGGTTFPVDHSIFALLKKEQCIPEDATVEQAQKLLASCCKVSELHTSFLLLKRYASAHAPRKVHEIRPPEPPSPPPAPPTPPPPSAKGRPHAAPKQNVKPSPAKPAAVKPVAERASKHPASPKKPRTQAASAGRRR